MPREEWEVIAKEYGVSLFPIFLLCDAVRHGVKKFVKRGAEMGLIIEKRVNTYIYKPRSWQLTHEAFVDKVQQNQNFLKNIFNDIKKYGDELVNFSKSVHRLDIKAHSSTKLNEFYQRYIKLNFKLYTVGVVVPYLDFHTTTFISDEVNTFLRSRVSPKKYQQYFKVFTAPTKFSSEKKQELDLLVIFADIKKIKKALRAFRQKNHNAIWGELPKPIQRKLNRHVAKYVWTLFLFEGPAADRGYFIDIIKDFIRRKIDPGQQIATITKEQRQLKALRQEYLKELRPDTYYKRILSYASEVVYWKVYRKEAQFESYYHIEFLLREIALRLHLTLRQVRMMLSEEISQALGKGTVDTAEINQRLLFAVYITKARGHTLFSGEAARRFVQKNVSLPKKQKAVKHLTGTTSCSGKARGTVKIINMVEDMEKFNEGDILVSSATNPNLMPAIRKAAAIVTDEGGLTCHAAIVSREFNIPCVIGTKIATKIFKDGDRVEVDADRGVVRKI